MNTHNKTHEFYMKKCFELAQKARGQTTPNPMVGSLIVKDNHIIGTGFHKKAGLAHAEKEAFSNLTQSAKGATLYCNLEPCCHVKKRTPPCTKEIIKRQIKTVVISNTDPNPHVDGKGVKELQNAGIKVITGVLKDEGERLNEIFFLNMREKKTFIHMKMASTLDGNIAMKSGESKWITSEKMRLFTHQQRFSHEAIAVSSQTFKTDNPQLTIRHPELPHKKLQKIIFTQSSFQTDKKDWLIINTKKITDLPAYLYENYHITSLYIEAGQKLATSFLNHDWVHKMTVCLAPKLLGKQLAMTGHLEGVSLQNPLHLHHPKWEQYGEDMAITGSIKK